MVSSEQRRKQLAREKYLRQQQRRAEARRKARIRNASIAGGLALALAAGGAYAAAGGLAADDEKKSDNAAAEPSATATSKAPDPCEKPAKGEPGDKQWKKEPKMSIDTSATYTMKLDTTCGDIEIEMDAAKAPRTVNSFEFLVGEGYLDHTKCHRLVTEGIHVLQCGDPTGTGQGGPGYTIPDENLDDPRVEKGTYPAGTVAMANRYNAQTKENRDSGGSQFFLVYEDSPLPPDYTPFGTVTKGMDVLKKIADAGSTMDPQTGNTPPNATVVIDKATVRKE
ncbi:peptidylprolyl isomerase [Streptomyces megasporus]|uniref:peptidylprolyl isomerase n=1 Tax=Streptomyces megasporus TaxID=44060 RepID=UPI0004E22194|nr:peptidylprolyl isomerase [Streptomyces megasporus]